MAKAGGASCAANPNLTLTPILTPTPTLTLTLTPGGASCAAMPGIFDEAWPDGLSPSAAAARLPSRLPWWAWLLVGAWCDARARARLRCGCRALRAVLEEQELWRSVLLRRRHAAALDI